MERRSVNLFRLFFWFVIVQGFVIEGRNLYVSQASGQDVWSCDQSKPCKTIWRAVTLASRGDHIYLDGTNTDKFPYTCQSGTSEHTGIYINKTLCLFGFASPMPQIRCSEGTGLVFIGSENAKETTVTLSGLFFNESFVRVQDFSVEIVDCKFMGIKQGLQFVKSTSRASIIEITNSTFSRNLKCISVVVNSSKSPSQNIQVAFKLTNSSFDSNVLSDDGGCISFAELAYTSQSVSCDINLENVTFSGNKFGSKGLVFLNMDNGNQNIHLQNVTFIDNSQLSGRDDLKVADCSEFIVNSKDANVSINSSNFTSHNARSLSVRASKILLQIFYSSYVGHRVEGNGGVVSLRGSDVCTLNVSSSSFINTTASQGGAINIKCTNVCRVCFKDNVFADNTAIDGEGGVLYIDLPGSVIKDVEYSTNDAVKFDYNGKNTEQINEINITKCDFKNTSSVSGGGAVHINYVKLLLRLFHSNFTSCTAKDGGGVFLNDSMTRKRSQYYGLILTVQGSRFIGCRGDGNSGSLSVVYNNTVQISINKSLFVSNDGSMGGAIGLLPVHSQDAALCFVSIEHTKFLNNSAYWGGAIYLSGNKGSFTLQTVTMISNRAEGAGAVRVEFIFGLTVVQSRFLNNTASSYDGGVFSVSNVHLIELEGCHFEGNAAYAGYAGVLSFSGYGMSLKPQLYVANTMFKNCWSFKGGGAIHLLNRDGVVYLYLTVLRTQFVDNYSLKGKGGGAIAIQLQEVRSAGSTETYSSKIKFENTTFERNTAVAGGALLLINGHARFRNCSFIDNFASTLGGHIYTGVFTYVFIGSASVTVQGSVFRQTLSSRPTPHAVYSMASFIHHEGSGKLELRNTTMVATPYGYTGPLLLVRKGKLIDLGNNNLTTFNCPVGSQLEILNFTDQVTTQVKNIFHQITVTTLEFSCSACAENSYSLQRGRALGSQLAPGFHCLPCPFGANCSQNVIAEPNFWGFQEKTTPPALEFIMCPLGYCRPPQNTDFPKYNSCKGNRSGKLCGQCDESYTETLYSPNCRPSHDCKDYWFWPVALVYVSFMALYFTFKPPIVPWIKRQILWFKQRKPTDEDKSFDSGYLKVVFYFYQAVNLLFVSNSSQHILKTTFIVPFLGLFNFQQRFSPNGLICPFPGLTVVTKQLFSASHVLGTFLMIVVFFLLHVGAHKFRGQECPSVGPYIGGILQTMLLGYTALASVSFNLLRCVPIGSEKRLFYDGNIVCFQWWQYILIAFICSFFVPFVFALLWGSFKLYSRTISVVKFLLACCLPLPFLLYWAYVSLFCEARNVTGEDSSSIQSSRNSVERVLYDCFKRPEDGSKLSLSWEGVMIGRRLFLIVLKAFINHSILRLLFMTLFCVLFLLQHAMTQPFRDGIANIVETISLLSIVVLALVNVFFACFLSLAVPLNDYFSSWWNTCQVVEIVILCVVPVVFGLLLVAAVLSQLCRLTVAVCCFLCRVFWVCFSWFCRKQNDEVRPLLASVS